MKYLFLLTVLTALVFSCGIDQNESAPIAEDWFLMNARLFDDCTVVKPTFIAGNPSCAKGKTTYEFSSGNINVEIIDGVHTWDAEFPEGFSVVLSEDGRYFSWSFDGGAYCLDGLSIIVKGGPDANSYIYEGDVTCGTGLVSPINRGGNVPAVSHVSFCYNLVRCEVEVCFTEETAWAANGDKPGSKRYVNRGNWATYADYAPGKTVNLYSGQTNFAGTATFSAVEDGFVTITIALAADHKLNDEADEPVKVQDYATAPNRNPSPGRFDYKDYSENEGTIVIQVKANNHYGIHLDVLREVTCEESE